MKHLPVLLLILSVPLVLAQSEKIVIEIEGTCINYNVTVSSDSLETGCYDVKINVRSPDGRIGEIYDPVEGWKSSFYYIKNGICSREKVFRLRVKSQKDFAVSAILKRGSRTWESDEIAVKQKCPEGMKPPEFFLWVLIVVLVLVAGISLYVKFGS